MGTFSHAKTLRIQPLRSQISPVKICKIVRHSNAEGADAILSKALDLLVMNKS